MTKIDPTQTISRSLVTHRDCSLIYLSHLQTSLITGHTYSLFPDHVKPTDCCSLVNGHTYSVVAWSLVTHTLFPDHWLHLQAGVSWSLVRPADFPWPLVTHADCSLIIGYMPCYTYRLVPWSLVTPTHLLPDHWLHQQTVVPWSLVFHTDFCDCWLHLQTDHWLHLQTCSLIIGYTHTLATWSLGTPTDLFPDHWLHLHTCSLITGYIFRLVLWSLVTPTYLFLTTGYTCRWLFPDLWLHIQCSLITGYTYRLVPWSLVTMSDYSWSLVTQQVLWDGKRDMLVFNFCGNGKLTVHLPLQDAGAGGDSSGPSPAKKGRGRPKGSGTKTPKVCSHCLWHSVTPVVALSRGKPLSGELAKQKCVDWSQTSMIIGYTYRLFPDHWLHLQTVVPQP